MNTLKIPGGNAHECPPDIQTIIEKAASIFKILDTFVMFHSLSFDELKPKQQDVFINPVKYMYDKTYVEEAKDIMRYMNLQAIQEASSNMTTLFFEELPDGAGRAAVAEVYALLLHKEMRLSLAANNVTNMNDATTEVSSSSHVPASSVTGNSK